MAEKPIIEVQGLTKRFKGLTAVHDVSFSVEKGSITGMIGPNGAGKSTTFNMICGYYPPTEGKIFYNGEDITNKKAYEYTNMKIARTFQIMKPLKNLSVLDNVTAAAYFGHAGAKSEKEAKERAMEVLQRIREEWDRAPVVERLAGERVRIPGFLVPLETNGEQISEFLLVPYFGACVHVPPPPANQIVHVKAAIPAKGLRSMDTVWITGTLRTERRDTDMGVSGYTVDGAVVEKYVEPPVTPR